MNQKGQQWGDATVIINFYNITYYTLMCVPMSAPVSSTRCDGLKAETVLPSLHLHLGPGAVEHLREGVS